MRNVPDPIEQGEARTERWADENVCGENFICGCGQQCKLDEGVQLSPKFVADAQRRGTNDDT